MQWTCLLLPFIFLTVRGQFSTGKVKCDINQVFHKCCNHVEKRCPGTGPPSNLKRNEPGCHCKEGFARDYEENCVPIESCFPPGNEANEQVYLLQQKLEQLEKQVEERKKEEKEMKDTQKQLISLIDILKSNALGKKDCDDKKEVRKDIDRVKEHIDIDHKHIMEQLTSQSDIDDRLKKIRERYEDKLKEMEKLTQEWEIKELHEKLEKIRLEKEILEKEQLEREEAERVRLELLKEEEKRKLKEEKRKLKEERKRLEEIRKKEEEKRLQKEKERAKEKEKQKQAEDNKNKQLTIIKGIRCRLSGGIYDEIRQHCICTGNFVNLDSNICKSKPPPKPTYNATINRYRLTTRRRCGGLRKGLLTSLLFGK